MIFYINVYTNYYNIISIIYYLLSILITIFKDFFYNKYPKSYKDIFSLQIKKKIFFLGVSA